eukprot:6938368-Prymnesium_polylepis.2
MASSVTCEMTAECLAHSSLDIKGGVPAVRLGFTSASTTSLDCSSTPCRRSDRAAPWRLTSRQGNIWQRVNERGTEVCCASTARSAPAE